MVAPSVGAMPGKSRASPSSWAFLALFCSTSVAVNVSGFGFASVALGAAEYYHVHVNLINALTVASFALSCVGYVPAMFAVDAAPVLVPLCCGAALGTLGAGLRAASADFAFAVAGQSIMALASPFVNSSPAAIGRELFPPNQRATVTSFGTLAQLLGMGLGLGISPAFRHNLDRWLLVQLYAMSAPAAGCILLCIWRAVFGLRPPPLAPPDDDEHPGASPTRARPSVAQFCRLCRALAQNSNFARLLLGFSLVTGVINALLSLVDQVGPAPLLDRNLGGLVGALFFGCGSLGAILVSSVVDRTRNYRFAIRCCAGALVPVLVLTFIAWDAEWWFGFPVLIGMAVMGFLGIPLFPLAVETGVEVAFQEDCNVEGAVNGLIQNSQNIAGVLITLLTTPHLVFPWLSADDVLLVWGAITLFGLGLMATITEDFRRLHREASNSYLALL